MDTELASMIQPRTPVAGLNRAEFEDSNRCFSIESVAPLVGMSPAFIRRVVGTKTALSVEDILLLLDQDAFGETFVPRSKILAYLHSRPSEQTQSPDGFDTPSPFELVHNNALDFARRMPDEAVNCIVTSTPYWAMRVYKESTAVAWADGEVVPYGHEQTPEAFVRHTIEMLYELKRVLTKDGSIWWNVMDTFNTRTQIRGNAAEALRAMQGAEQGKAWTDHAYRRYSAGHSFLKDGEQIGIPFMIAQRASRIGLFLKSTITWAKTATLPEPQRSRVSRQLEYVLHFSKQRAPKFHKETYSKLGSELGGRNELLETAKLSDVWVIPTSSGGDGHGAQFPAALPGRCIALSTDPGDIVFDPFVGSGTSVVAALALGRRAIGVDTSKEYIATAGRKVAAFLGTVITDEQLRPPDIRAV